MPVCFLRKHLNITQIETRTMPQKRSPMRLVFVRVIGILVFIILLTLANIIYPYLHGRFFTEFVSFLNSNLELIVVMSILFLLGELFSLFFFPFNIPGPLFTGFGSMLLISFVFGLMGALDYILNLGIYNFFKWFAYLLFPCVFGVVIIIGYIQLFTKELKPEEEEIIDLTATGWQEIAGEFKLLILDMVQGLRRVFKRSKKQQEKARDNKP